MSRSASPLGYLWLWSDGDNPGAGSKTLSKTAGGTGLNANFIELENGVFTEHNANGTHKNDKIDGASLKNTVADGSTLEFNNSTGAKVIRVKDGGVTLVKLNSSGAAAGQSPVWNGTAIVWSNPTPTIADASITRAKAANLYKGVTSYQLFGDHRVAGTSSGNATAAATEWRESGASTVKKFECTIQKRPEDRYIRVCGNAKTSINTRAWFVELLINGSVVESRTGTNTSYDLANRDFDFYYAIADGTPLAQVAILEVAIGMRLASTPANMDMTNLNVTVVGHNSDAS